MLAGRSERALAILRGLRGEGEALPLVLWAVGDEIRLLARLAAIQAAGGDINAEMRRNRVFGPREQGLKRTLDRKSTRLNSSHVKISYAVFCLKKKKKNRKVTRTKKTRSHREAD